VKTSSEDAEESKPAPDIFEIVLKKLGIQGRDAVASGDSPYHAVAAGKIATIGVLCGGFREDSLREAGGVEVYPRPTALLARSRTRYQISSCSSRTGSLRSRWPVAWKIALHTAALVPTLPSSPMPFTPAGLM
jgi:hypothetical protein